MRTQASTNLILVAHCLLCVVSCAVVPVPEVESRNRPTAVSKPQRTEGSAKVIPPVFESAQQLPDRKTPESADETVVRTRAKARWALLLEKKLQDSYAYVSPAYAKLTPYSMYASGINPDAWKKATVASTICAVETCEVIVNVTIKIALPRIGLVDHESLIRERWVLANGQWWFVPAT
jgi:hypothetical protein